MLNALRRRRLARSQARSASGFGLQYLLHATVAARWQFDWRQILAFHDQFDLVGIEHLALQQCCGDAVHYLLVTAKDVGRGVVSLVNQAPNLHIDLLRRVLAEVTMLIDFASEEDLLFLLAEGDWSERTHTEFADHATGEIRGLLDVIAGAGGHLSQEDLFGDATPHHHRQPAL